jgi:hypothetical protein
MGRFCWLVLGVVLVLAPASPSAAKLVEIETTSPLEDHTEESVRVALEAAVKDAVTRAIAIGVPWVRMSHALVLEDAVVVRILATDTDPETGTGEDAWEPDTEPEARAEESLQSEL